MEVPQDLINFDVIEEQKENIQSLPGGRSARYLASMFSPSPVAGKGALLPTMGDTQNLNDTIRREYETELLSISESDDPLDIYDRYVKWALYAYPSAQATSQSQLLPLLERATKTFLTSTHYKNDPRYLKLWLHYIRFFCETPRETFSFLARHGIGEGLALYYEEFAAWLEGAGRWAQADEVYVLGLQREARPAERLLRKYSQFQERYNQRPDNENGPSSPALPTVRPALAAKIDPFAASTPTPADPQAPRGPGFGGSTSKPARQKLAVFSDSGAPESAIRADAAENSKGWENIGSLAHRKKENVIEPRPWAGETMKAGKKVGAVPKMAVFKDQSLPQAPNTQNKVYLQSKGELRQQQQINVRTGRAERVFVNLEACYPNPDDPSNEMSFEELRAKKRGWLDKVWAKKDKKIEASGKIGLSMVDPMEESLGEFVGVPEPQPKKASPLRVFRDEAKENFMPEQRKGPSRHQPIQLPPSDENQRLPDEKYGVQDDTREANRTRKIKIKEIKGEPQIIKTNLESPTGPKIKRKISAEPTMTFHTKAATDEIYDIFNQPLKTPNDQNEDDFTEGDDDYDDCTSGGESTGTGLIDSRGTSRAASEVGDDEEDDVKSEWSDFTTRKHLPGLQTNDDEETGNSTHEDDNVDGLTDQFSAVSISNDLVTPTSPKPEPVEVRTKFIPIPPEDYEPPSRSYRDPLKVSQNRLPFMTPIVEKTESSLGMSTRNDTRNEKRSMAAAKTPSRTTSVKGSSFAHDDDLMSSPFQEYLDVVASESNKISQPPLMQMAKAKAAAVPAKAQKSTQSAHGGKEIVPKGPIIKDEQCNPTEEYIRNLILEKLQPPISSYEGYLEQREQMSARSMEIRKFAKFAEKKADGKTATGIVMPPILRFEGADREYMVRKELGKGAFAPVYLVENTAMEDDPDDEDMPAVMGKGKFGVERKKLEAIKMEDPPTAWEFYIIRQAKRRLGVSRAADSVIHAYEMHLFQDEGFLIEEYRDQGTLLEIVNIAKTDASGSGVMDESLVMFFTIELFRTVEALHAKGILHGDLKADNCLVRFDPVADGEWSSKYHRDGTAGWNQKGLALIDFGRGIDMKLFSPTVQFIADWKTGPQDCAEMREMRPWTYQVDYHGLAGIVHCMLFSKYIDTVADRGGRLGSGATKTYKISAPLKRYWQQDIWNAVFDLLLNPLQHVEKEEKNAMPILRGMRTVREEMESWLEANCEKGLGLKSIIRRLEAACRERKRDSGR